MKLLLRIVSSVLALGIVVALAADAYVLYRHREETVLCPNCNIILISIDTFDTRYLSDDTNNLETTPFLKQLEDTRGIVFENAYAQAPWTLPSYASLFTGRYPWDASVKVWTAFDAFPATVPTLFTYLQKNGYATKGISDGPFIETRYGITRGMDAFTQYSPGTNPAGWNDLPGLFESASAWLSARNAAEPFILFLHPFETHEPYGDPSALDGVSYTQILAMNTKPGGPTEADNTHLLDAYEKELTTTDASLKEFFTTFDASPNAKNTIVVITSDNGETFGAHGYAGIHVFDLHGETLRVPLIIVLPNSMHKRILASVELRSLPETLLEMVGYGDNSDFLGASLMPYITGSETANQLIVSATAFDGNAFLTAINTDADGRRTTEWSPPETPEPGSGPGQPGAQYSAIVGRWHALRGTTGTVSLYDMETDPDEQTDIIDSIDTLPSADQSAAKEAVTAVLAFP